MTGIIMDKLRLETFEGANSELDDYLSNSIMSYGLKQLQGHQLVKLYCCYRNGGNLSGAVMGSATRNLFFITHLFVEENQRGNGVGTKLLSAIETSAIKAQCTILRLNTLNKQTHSLYVNAGYQETICISNYFTGFDLVYYHKEIH